MRRRACCIRLPVAWPGHCYGRLHFSYHGSGHENAAFVDTGSSLTLLSTKLASQLELPINVNTRRTILILAGGREVAVPRVRLASVKLATAAVENLSIGVYDVLPATPEIHGVLGMDFLGISPCRSITGAAS